MRLTGRQLLEDASHTGRDGVGRRFARIYARITGDRTPYCSNAGPSDHLASIKSCKGRLTPRAWHVRDGRERGLDINRFASRHLQQQGVLAIAVCPSAGNAYDDASGRYWKTAHHKAGAGTQRTRNWSRGTVRTTCWHLGAFHAPLSANQGRTPGSSENRRGHQRGTQRTRHRSRGTAQTTFWHFGALHVSLAGNRDRALANCSLSPLGNFTCNLGTRVTYLLPDHLRHGTQSQMATIGTHDAPLRGHVLVEGVVTFCADDFDADVTKEEVLAKFFVPDKKMDVVPETVAMYGPFCGPSHTLVEANRLKVLAR